MDENSKYYFGRFKGNPIMVSGEKDVIYIPESLVENVEQRFSKSMTTFILLLMELE